MLFVSFLMLASAGHAATPEADTWTALIHPQKNNARLLKLIDQLPDKATCKARAAEIAGESGKWQCGRNCKALPNQIKLKHCEKIISSDDTGWWPFW